MEALQKLEAWIEREKSHYQKYKSTMSVEALSTEIDRQLCLLEFQTQIIRCKEEETQEFMNKNFPFNLCDEVNHNSQTDFTTGL